ncbi:hypothetical protein BDN67DRAFT_673299 [Paxillus ammoniavirescens]|nr:hypothetical protein BDN67DRAFT_673299 [Paxillus ammoniavirescens]
MQAYNKRTLACPFRLFLFAQPVLLLPPLRFFCYTTSLCSHIHRDLPSELIYCSTAFIAVYRARTLSTEVLTLSSLRSCCMFVPLSPPCPYSSSPN